MSISERGFFVSGPLSCFVSTKLWKFDNQKIDEYQDDLKQILTLNSQREKDVVVETKWTLDRVKLDNIRLFRSFILIRTQQDVYHNVCMLYPNWSHETDAESRHASALFFLRASNHIQSCVLEYFSKAFDTLVRPFKFPQKFLYTTLNHYLMDEIKTESLIGNSQMIFKLPGISDDDDPQLSKITLSLRPNDLRHIYSRTDGTQPLISFVYKYLNRHTSLDFEAFQLTRIDCPGFSITTNAKIRFSNKGIHDEQLWAIIGQAYQLAQTTFHTLATS